MNLNIIYIDFTNLNMKELKEYHARLIMYIEDKYQKKMQNYLFIDEVQIVSEILN